MTSLGNTFFGLGRVGRALGRVGRAENYVKENIFTLKKKVVDFRFGTTLKTYFEKKEEKGCMK